MNILLKKSAKKLIKEKEFTINSIKELINEASGNYSEEHLQEWKKFIEKLEDEIFEIDDIRYFLVNKENQTDIIIDFWKEYESNIVNNVNEKYYQLMEVSFTNSNDDDCFSLIDFKGHIVVSECIDYGFVGKEIKILQFGYMIGSLDVRYDDTYWSLVDSNEISGVQSIEFLEDLDFFLVDEIKCYNQFFEYVGTINEFIRKK